MPLGALGPGWPALSRVCTALGGCTPKQSVASSNLARGRYQAKCGFGRLCSVQGTISCGGRDLLTVNVTGSRYGVAMTASPASDPGPYEVIHLGGEAAAIVPLSDLCRLQAVQRHAPAELLEEAEVEATLAAHRDWVAAGRPGAVSHEEAMAELLAQRR
jgi:hypothetical protein